MKKYNNYVIRSETTDVALKRIQALITAEDFDILSNNVKAIRDLMVVNKSLFKVTPFIKLFFTLPDKVNFTLLIGRNKLTFKRIEDTREGHLFSQAIERLAVEITAINSSTASVLRSHPGDGEVKIEHIDEYLYIVKEDVLPYAANLKRRLAHKPT